jgi:hypothetical protein
MVGQRLEHGYSLRGIRAGRKPPSHVGRMGASTGSRYEAIFATISVVESFVLIVLP